MVNIFSNIIQIIVLSSSTNTFLRVGNPDPFGHVAVRIDSSKEKGLELQNRNMYHMTSSIINQDKKKDTKVNQETWNEGKFWLIVVTQQVGTAGNFIKIMGWMFNKLGETRKNCRNLGNLEKVGNVRE